MKKLSPRLILILGLLFLTFIISVTRERQTIQSNAATTTVVSFAPASSWEIH